MSNARVLSQLVSDGLPKNASLSGAEDLILNYVNTANIFESASVDYISVTMLDSTRAIVTYIDNGNSSYGTACVLSVSGTTITTGTPVVF